MKTRIKKVCAGFHASLYPCPSTLGERNDMLKGVRTRLEDLNLVSTLLQCKGVDEGTKICLGPQPNQRSPSKGVNECGERASKLEHHGEQDEGDLPHAELLQHGRDEEVSDWGMLGALQRYSNGPKGLGRRFCKYPICLCQKHDFVCDLYSNA